MARAMQLISLMISLAMRYRRALLAAEDDGFGGCRAGGTPEPIVDSDQLQNVQVLVLVLVQALHLDIEQRVQICNNVGSPSLIRRARTRLLSALTACQFL